VAKELVELYARRKAVKGHAFASGGEWDEEFGKTFEYEETDDQLRSIREIRQDMEAETSMDRLLCGDVGYGKTEVAMRAAFLAVMDGKQVAVLCPTTVLASQHLKTFRARMALFPVRIEALTRLETPREQKAVVEDCRKASSTSSSGPTACSRRTSASRTWACSSSTRSSASASATRKRSSSSRRRSTS